MTCADDEFEVFTPDEALDEISENTIDIEAEDRREKPRRRKGRLDPRREEIRDDDVFIVAGGPSRNGFDLSLLTGRTVLTVNYSYLEFRDFTASFFYDFAFIKPLPPEEFQFIRDNASRFYTIKATARSVRIDGLNELKLLHDWHGRKGCAARISNSGAMALSWALNNYPKSTIRLLGFDMKPGPDGRLHAENEIYSSRDDFATEKQLRMFRKRADEFHTFARFAGRVINYSPDSALEMFDKRSLEELMEVLHVSK